MKRDPLPAPKPQMPNKHAVYESMKASLPPMTPAEYQAACQRIAQALGI